MRRGLAAIATIVAVALAGCGGREDARPASTGGAATDRSAPSIDERRLEQMIASLQEADNPFGPILRGDTGVSAEQLVSRLDEMNAFARRHGFRDHDEYLQIWLRVTLVEMSDVAAELDELAAQASTQIEARLRDPALTAAQREELTRKLAEARAELANDNLTPDVDPADLALIRAHRGELSAALARWR